MKVVCKEYTPKNIPMIDYLICNEKIKVMYKNKSTKQNKIENIEDMLNLVSHLKSILQIVWKDIFNYKVMRS